MIIGGPSVSAIIDKILVPLVAALIAWFVKDFLVGTYAARREEARKEWQFRLREFYSPLFLWSGVALFSVKANGPKLGVGQLADVLSKGANLLPIKEYFIFVKILEHATGQSTTRPTMKEIQKARDYVYSRIEVLNVALFAQARHFELRRPGDPLEFVRAAWSAAMGSLIQVVIWLTLTSLVLLLYRIVAGNIVAVTLLGVLIVLIMAEELSRRIRWYREINSRLKS